jgi:oligopeptide/dipeptide ABC transporter ATP-binding protein
MRQRAMIAMAVACHPRVLIADEPTTGLDVTVQAQVLHLVAGLVRDSGTTLLLISHDLGVVAGMADRVLVMYRGRIVESAGADDLFTSPWHPYTIGLLASVPRLDRPRPHRMHTIAGRPPEASESIVGCSFAPRCPAATARCRVDDPALEPVGPGREVACWNWRSADRPADVS